MWYLTVFSDRLFSAISDGRTHGGSLLPFLALDSNGLRRHWSSSKHLGLWQAIIY